MMIRPVRSALLLVGATLMLTACGGEERPVGYAPALPAAPPVQAATQPHNGAIFQAANGYAPLHVGNRARQVGDLVTVVLTERTSTSKSTSSSTDRSGGISLAPPSTGPFSFNPSALNSSGSASFNGGGDASQSSNLRGDITVTIAEVRPNGTALIRGEKLMELSQGEEWIQLSGIIRLADLDAESRISSPRVADAHITYGGKGAIQQSSRPGWLSRFFNIVSPF